MKTNKNKTAILIALAIFMALPFFSGIANAQVKNIVLVHGAWGDGSGWEGVYKILVAKGYHVDVVSNSDQSLTADVASVRAVLARQKGPVILVGHSYGGAIITQAGDTSNVAALVYVSAFAPDEGESLLSLQKAGPPNPESGIMPPVNGLLWYDTAKYYKDFCPDLSPALADFTHSVIKSERSFPDQLPAEARQSFISFCQDGDCISASVIFPASSMVGYFFSTFSCIQ